MIRLLTITIAIACVTSALAEPLTISGPARIIDGDTIAIGDTHVRLHGIDAAELGDPLGDDARQVMLGIVGDGELRCVLTGEHTWHREVGFCFTSAGVHIGQAIVEMGAALSCPRYSTRYLPFEQPETLAAQPRASYCLPRRR